MSPQQEAVLKYMKTNGGITSYDAFSKLRITRLSAVIYDLKDIGYNIDKVYEQNKKTGTSYARYFLVKKNGKK